MKNTNIILYTTIFILFLLVAVMVLSRTNTGLTLNTNSPTPTESITLTSLPETTTPGVTVTGAMEEKKIMINLDAQPGSTYNQSGKATLTETNGKVKVLLELNTVDMLKDPQPAHIHKGACPKPGDVVYPLTNVINGKSETIIDTTMDNLKKQFPLAINVHKSASESSVYTACGDLK